MEIKHVKDMLHEKNSIYSKYNENAFLIIIL